MGSGDRGRQWGKCPCSKISSPSAKDISLVGRVRIKVASHYHLWPVTCSSISSQRNEVEYHFEGTLQAYVFSAGIRTVKDFASASRGNLTNHVLQSCIPFSPSCPVGKACSACRCTSGTSFSSSFRLSLSKSTWHCLAVALRAEGYTTNSAVLVKVGDIFLQRKK